MVRSFPSFLVVVFVSLLLAGCGGDSVSERELDQLEVLNEQEEDLSQVLPGDYDSNVTFHGSPMLHALPKVAAERFPEGIVWHFSERPDESFTLPGEQAPERLWVLSPRDGPNRFVRVEQMASQVSLYRGTEVFVWAKSGVSKEQLGAVLPTDRYEVSEAKGEKDFLIVQFTNESPEGLPSALEELGQHALVEKVAPCPIE